MIASSDKIGGRVRVPAFRLHNCQGQQQQDDKLSHIARDSRRLWLGHISQGSARVESAIMY
jgi:hypothetical protein